MDEYRAGACVDAAVSRSRQCLPGQAAILHVRRKKLLLYPQPTSGTLVLYYHAEYPALSADSDENVLTQAAPDLVIYGALSLASDFYLDQRAEIFETKFQQFLTEMQEQANDQELQGGTQSVPAFLFISRRGKSHGKFQLSLAQAARPLL